MTTGVISNFVKPAAVVESKLKIDLELKQSEIEKLTLGSLRKAVFEGDMDFGSIMAGQSAGLVKAVRPVKVILEDIYLNSKTFKGLI